MAKIILITILLLIGLFFLKRGKQRHKTIRQRRKHILDRMRKR